MIKGRVMNACKPIIKLHKEAGDKNEDSNIITLKQTIR
jgi:hypothetical protein